MCLSGSKSAEALGLPPGWFAPGFSGMIPYKLDAKPDCTLRVSFYPHTAGAFQAPGAAGPRLRYGEHVDFTTLTIVRPDAAPGGLEIKRFASGGAAAAAAAGGGAGPIDRSEDGEWVAVPYVPGALIIHSGDLLHRWTNGKWRPAVHRVAAPPLDPALEAALRGEAEPLPRPFGAPPKFGSDSLVYTGGIQARYR
eukprot:SAG22_NODE_2125_length_2972_cov_36.467804_3_plen_195_part_00